VKIVLDSNALLVSIPKKSQYRPIFNSLLLEDYTLAISNEVLLEYIEVVARFANEIVASNIAELLTLLSNVDKTEVYYRWNLITVDFDDNKFVDLAIASGADYIVTNDSHFDVLQKIPFPKVEIISIDDFLKKLHALRA
jgi:putative PIN family toxin of toxin-antitoxin system